MIYRRFPFLKRRLVRLLLLLLSAIGLIATVLAIYIYLYGQVDHAAPADIIIILGAGTRNSGAPTDATFRRVLHGVALYRQGLAPYLLCTGGITQNHPKSEAQACAEVAQTQGVPTTAILLEEHSTSTEENAIEARKVMDAHNLKTAILVTDNFHIFRAEILFHAQQIPIVSSPAQVTMGPLGPRTVILDTYREVAALGWYVFKTTLGLPFTSTHPS